jgi:dsDNA-specific endonuclease/ATPase MutS2
MVNSSNSTAATPNSSKFANILLELKGDDGNDSNSRIDSNSQCYGFSNSQLQFGISNTNNQIDDIINIMKRVSSSNYLSDNMIQSNQDSKTYDDKVRYKTYS